MANTNIFLKQMKVTNFLSLHEVSLSFKPLTVLVGANASGKSNILKACLVLHQMIQRRDKLPNSNNIQDWIWAGQSDGQIAFEIQLEIDNHRTVYQLVLHPQTRKMDKSRQYKEALAPKIAEYIKIDATTLKRNESLTKLGEQLNECSND